MAARTLTFWHVAGEIIYRANGRPMPIDEAQAQGLRGLYRDEARAAWHAGDREASVKATSLWVEIGRARDALAEWKRAHRSFAIPGRATVGSTLNDGVRP